MGIRLHKMIGYGIADLKCQKPKSKYGHATAIDPRINWEAFYSRLDREDANLADFIIWMKAHKEEILALEKREHIGRKFDDWGFKWALKGLEEQTKKPWQRNFDVLNCVVHAEEYGLARVCLFIPPEEYHSWCRYDDIMDWVDETADRKQRNWVKQIPGCGIYPYCARMIRFREPSESLIQGEPDPLQFETGMDTFDELGPTSLVPASYSMLIGTWSKKNKPLASGKLLEHIKNDFRPVVPISVLALILWLGKECIPEPEKFIDNLRPLRYCYWG